MWIKLLCITGILLCFNGTGTAERSNPRGKYDWCQERQRFNLKKCNTTIFELLDSDMVYSFSRSAGKCRPVHEVCSSAQANVFNSKKKCSFYCGREDKKGCYSSSNRRWYEHGDRMGRYGCCQCNDGVKLCATCNPSSDSDFCRECNFGYNSDNQIQGIQEVDICHGINPFCPYGYDHYCDCINKRVYCRVKCDRCWSGDITCPDECDCGDVPLEIPAVQVY